MTGRALSSRHTSRQITESTDLSSNDQIDPLGCMVRPLAVRRHNEIVQRLRAAGSVSVGELAEIFGVSHETVRRDLKLLADQGHLDVVHGGASRRGMMEPPISERGEENPQGKAAIARTAARMVDNESTVLIDSGTTSAALALELVGRPGLTICTNSLNHALTLCRVHGRMILTGRAYLLADHTKFTRRTPFRVPHMDKCAGVIVDQMPDRALAAAWTSLGLEIIQAK
jgi:DeoR/GlpR family transcriptional regulator of sugar metabolism